MPFRRRVRWSCVETAQIEANGANYLYAATANVSMFMLRASTMCYICSGDGNCGRIEELKARGYGIIKVIYCKVYDQSYYFIISILTSC